MPESKKKRKWGCIWPVLIVIVVAIILISIGDSPETVSVDTTPAPTTSTQTAEAQPQVPENYTGETILESNDGFVTDFNAVQVMAKGFDSETGNIFDMSQFVAGKSTMIRVGFDNWVDVQQDGSMYLRICRDSEEIIDLLPVNSGSSNKAYFIPRNMGDVDNWAAGEYILEFNYGGSNASRTMTMLEARKIKVLGVPIVANYGGQVVYCRGEWRTAI